MEATMLMRRMPEYPHEAVKAGLEALGYRVHFDLEPKPGRSDLVVTWNAYGRWGDWARQFRLAGGPHVVFENGYMRRSDGYFLMSRDGFNGQGWIPPIPDSPKRAPTMRLSPEPWRAPGNHILVCAQRGGGYSSLAMRDSWPDEILTELRRHTDRPIWYRPHPGRTRLPQKKHDGVTIVNNRESLQAQLVNCHAAVVWTSFSALEALHFGVPAFYCGPTMICSEMMTQGVEKIEDPLRVDDRDQYFEALAWNLWHRDEIASGAALSFVLGKEKAK